LKDSGDITKLVAAYGVIRTNSICSNSIIVHER
jgi:hypothetical protein